MKKIFTYIFSILIAVCLYGFFIHFKVAATLDTTQERYKEKSSYQTALVSYADNRDVYKLNQQALNVSGQLLNFDAIFSFDKKFLMNDGDFVKKNKHVLEQKTGDGYWLWKPYIILKIMEMLPDNYFLMYADCGYVITQDLSHIWEIADKHQIVVVQGHVPIESRVQRQTLINTNCDTQQCITAPYIEASCLVLKNTKETREFVKTWLEVTKNPTSVINTPPPKGFSEHKNFSHHLHDSATLSVVTFQYKNKIPIYHMPYSELYQYMFWHHRKENHEKFGKSLMPDVMRLGKKIRGFERDIYNWLPFCWLRNMF